MTIGGPSTPPLRTTLSSARGALAGAPAFAVGTPVARRPPHRSVRLIRSGPLPPCSLPSSLLCRCQTSSRLTPPLRTTLSSARGALAGAPASHPDCHGYRAPPQPPLWLDRRPPVDPVTWRTAVTHRARARESSRRAETAAPSRETAVLQWCSARPRVGSRGGGELPDRNEAHAGWRAKLPAWGSAAGGRAALRACIHGAPTHQRGPQRAVGSTRFHHACTPCTPPQD